MGPAWGPWVLSAPDGPHVSPMNLAIRDWNNFLIEGALKDIGKSASEKTRESVNSVHSSHRVEAIGVYSNWHRNK